MLELDINTQAAFDDESTPMITPSEVIEHIFCPRFTYFMQCLNIPQHEEQRYKVIKGRQMHEMRQNKNVNYLRKKLGCKKKEFSVYLASKKMGIRGIVDEILYLSDETLAPLDYKFAEYKEHTFQTHKVQSSLYSLLIMENYLKPVKKGYICYARTNFKISELVYKDEDFSYAKGIVNEIFDVILHGFFPKKTKSKSRCLDCCYKNICA